MSRPIQSNLAVHRVLDAKRKKLLSNYIDSIKNVDIAIPTQETAPLKIPKFKTPEVKKFEPIEVPKIEFKEYKPQEQSNTLDDFEREYQAFIENLKKEKEKKELKEELKAYCREYINELFGIETPVENKPEEHVEEPEEETKELDISNLEGNNVIKEAKSFDEEYADFINSLKQTKRKYNDE
jgi:hypothetical protein